VQGHCSESLINQWSNPLGLQLCSIAVSTQLSVGSVFQQLALAVGLSLLLSVGTTVLVVVGASPVGSAPPVTPALAFIWLSLLAIGFGSWFITNHVSG
jgi:small-conductance mechanosensitive channel